MRNSCGGLVVSTTPFSTLPDSSGQVNGVGVGLAGTGLGVNVAGIGLGVKVTAAVGVWEMNV